MNDMLELADEKEIQMFDESSLIAARPYPAH